MEAIEIIRLLSESADSRSIINEDGMTTYATSIEPIEHLALGSCTGSSLSKRAWDLLGSIDLDQHDWSNVRKRFAKLMGLDSLDVNICFTPSGTDAETLISHVLCQYTDDDIENLVVAPTEIGSGSVLAAAGLRFDELAPDGSIGLKGDVLIPRINHRIRVSNIDIRSQEGVLLNKDIIIAKCHSKIFQAIEEGREVIIHLVAGSKTSVHAPSRTYVEQMQELVGDKLHVVVDAAQGRFSRSGIRTCLERGWIVMTTGSKFFGGPPFSGAVIFPNRYDLKDIWTEDLSPLFTQSALKPNHGYPVERQGLLVRWIAALTEMENYFAIPSEMRFSLLKWFEEDAPSLVNSRPELTTIAKSPDDEDLRYRLLQSNLTVISFKIEHPKTGSWMSVEELRQLHRSLMKKTEQGQTLVHLGQPVFLTPNGEIGALRIALGGVIMQNFNALSMAGQTKSQIRRALNDMLETAIESLISALKHKWLETLMESSENQEGVR